MIKYCEYADNTMKESCDELIKGSVKIFGPATGVCYSFNFVGLDKKKNPAPVVYGGQEFGLQLIIDIEGEYDTHYPKIIFGQGLNRFQILFFVIFFRFRRRLLYEECSHPKSRSESSCRT